MKAQDKAAIVTGGGSGLGAATARRLAAEGAKVALLDVNLEQADKVAREIGGIAIACDVSNAKAAEAAVAKAAEAHGDARILVNCAGIAPATRVVGREGPHDLDLFRKVIEVNLVGSFNMLRLVADRASRLDPLEDGERAIIVSTASVAAFDGQIGQASYSASKGGVVGMTLPIARDLAAVGVRVNTVAPGLIDTPIYGEGEASEAFKDNLKKGVLFPQRLGAPDELASMVVECVTNSYMNAETIRVDGGIRMQPK